MLPLVQFALQELFDRREVKDGETVLSFAAYRELGGLDGAIDKRAEAAIASLGEAEQGALPRLLRQLAVPAREKDGASTLTIRPAAARRSCARRGVETSGRARLIDARILLSSGNEGTASVRLAHERVLKSWKRAAGIVRENAVFYRMREDAEDQLERWRAADKSDDLLIPPGLPLEEARKLIAGYGDELDPRTRDYIEVSIAREQRRRRARLFRVAAAVGVPLVLIAVFASTYAAQQAEFAAEQAEHAASELLLRLRAEQQAVRARQEADKAKRNFSAAKNAIDGLNGLIYNVAQGLQNVVGMRVDAVKNTLAEVSKTIDALDKSAPDDAELKLSRSRMLANFVDAYLAAGALQDAEGAANDGLGAAKAVVAKEPDNGDAQRALAVSLYKLGDVKLKAGDAAGALQDYQQSHDTRGRSPRANVKLRARDCCG